MVIYSYWNVAVTEYTPLTVSEYGTVRGDENIMAEIYARGPVSAYINAVYLYI